MKLFLILSYSIVYNSDDDDNDSNDEIITLIIVAMACISVVS